MSENQRQAQEERKPTWLQWAVGVTIVVSIIIGVVANSLGLLDGVIDRVEKFNKPDPSISIVAYTDEYGDDVSVDAAPFKLKISLDISNVEDYYAYLIVQNEYGEYIQPQGGKGKEGKSITMYAHLGLLDGSGESLNKQYDVFGIITDKVQKPNLKLDENAKILARSESLQFTRTKIEP